MKRFEVIFETAIYRSIIVEAEDQDEAADKAAEIFLPGPDVPLPTGFELNDGWFVEGAYDVRDYD